jgi:hypothetical protein
LSCPVLAGLGWTFLVHILAFSRVPLFCYPVLAVLFWQSCPSNPVLAVLFRLSCPSGDGLAVLSWLSLSCLSLSYFHCPGCLSWLLYPDCPALRSSSDCPVLAVLSWLSSPGCPVLAVLSWLSYPGCPFLAVLSWLSCPGHLVSLSSSCCPLHCPVIALRFLLPSSLSYYSTPVLAALFTVLL